MEKRPLFLHHNETQVSSVLISFPPRKKKFRERRLTGNAQKNVREQQAVSLCAMADSDASSSASASASAASAASRQHRSRSSRGGGGGGQNPLMTRLERTLKRSRSLLSRSKLFFFLKCYKRNLFRCKIVCRSSSRRSHHKSSASDDSGVTPVQGRRRGGGGDGDGDSGRGTLGRSPDIAGWW